VLLYGQRAQGLHVGPYGMQSELAVADSRQPTANSHPLRLHGRGCTGAQWRTYSGRCTM
jgi:hypothetical protein